MLEDVLRRKTFRVLFDRTRFKKSQLDALLVRRYALENHVKLREVLALRDKQTSLGSMERSAFQAEGVISASIATLVLALSLDLISPTVIDSIPRIASILEQATTHEPSDDELARFSVLVSAMLHRASHK